MTTDDPLLDFFAARQALLVKKLDVSVARIARARRRNLQEWHDDWEACQPRSIGHAMGRRKGTLEDLDDE